MLDSLRILFSLLALCFLTACTRAMPSAVPATPLESAKQNIPNEVAVKPIPLAGPITKAEAEISGMGWFSETLILLPQYPARFGDGDGAVFAIPQAALIAFLNGEQTQAIQPSEIPLEAPGLDQIPGFEGYEAIAFAGEQAFLTIESRPGKMLGYLVKGKMAPDLSRLSIDPSQRTPIEAQSPIANLSDEALLVVGERVVTFYEANGAQANPQATAHLFDLALRPQGELPFPNLEYRLTDVTSLDEAGHFWAMNYFYPGDDPLRADLDPLAEASGEGKTHAQAEIVERLVEYQFTENGILRTDTPPIWLQLSSEARNWEGIARLQAAGLMPGGFLLVTDKYPQTLLAYIAWP